MRMQRISAFTFYSCTTTGPETCFVATARIVCIYEQCHQTATSSAKWSHCKSPFSGQSVDSSGWRRGTLSIVCHTNARPTLQGPRMCNDLGQFGSCLTESTGKLQFKKYKLLRVGHSQHCKPVITGWSIQHSGCSTVRLTSSKHLSLWMLGTKCHHSVQQTESQRWWRDTTPQHNQTTYTVWQQYGSKQPTDEQSNRLLSKAIKLSHLST